MPIYEYKCEGCDHIFERIVSISESKNQLIECEKCRKKLAHKVPSIFSSTTSESKADKEVVNNYRHKSERAAIRVGKNVNLTINRCLVKGASFVNAHPKANVTIKNSIRIP